MKKRAFTMAEAILVMTILGIIATIMISTLKPQQFKDKGLAVMADKVLGEIDTATTQILLNNSQKNTMATLYTPGGTTTTFSSGTATTTVSNNLGKLYKGYLTATRRACDSDATCKACNNYQNKFYLKDGVCIGITAGTPAANVNTWFPGETKETAIKPTHGQLFFDINGEKEPNVMGKDQFLLPFNEDGIQYSSD